MQAQQNEGNLVRGQSLAQGPLSSDAQKQLLAQLNSNGLLKQGQLPGLGAMNFEGFTPSQGGSLQNASSALQLAQRHQLMAQLVSQSFV